MVNPGAKQQHQNFNEKILVVNLNKLNLDECNKSLQSVPKLVKLFTLIGSDAVFLYSYSSSPLGAGQSAIIGNLAYYMLGVIALSVFAHSEGDFGEVFNLYIESCKKQGKDPFFVFGIYEGEGEGKGTKQVFGLDVGYLNDILQQAQKRGAGFSFRDILKQINVCIFYILYSVENKQPSLTSHSIVKKNCAPNTPWSLEELHFMLPALTFCAPLGEHYKSVFDLLRADVERVNRQKNDHNLQHQQRISTLESRISTLESRISELESRISELESLKKIN